MARGLLRVKQRQILLLDEPTSSLDPRTEREIFMSLFSRYSDRIVITACHRLNLVPLFDKIICVREGRIVEVGSFEQLLGRGGCFSSAWREYQEKAQKVEAPAQVTSN